MCIHASTIAHCLVLPAVGEKSPQVSILKKLCVPSIFSKAVVERINVKSTYIIYVYIYFFKSITQT